MATINEEYAAIENALAGMPEGLYAIQAEFRRVMREEAEVL